MKRISIEVNLQTKDGLNPRLPASRDELNRTREQVVIGESQRGHAMSRCHVDKFGRCGESFLQGVCGVAGEVDGQGVGVGSGSMGNIYGGVLVVIGESITVGTVGGG